MIPFGNHPLFLALLGWMLPPKPAFMKFTTTPVIRAMTFTKQVFQDIVLPINKYVCLGIKMELSWSREQTLRCPKFEYFLLRTNNFLRMHRSQIQNQKSNNICHIFQAWGANRCEWEAFRYVAHLGLPLPYLQWRQGPIAKPKARPDGPWSRLRHVQWPGSLRSAQTSQRKAEVIRQIGFWRSVEERGIN